MKAKSAVKYVSPATITSGLKRDRFRTRIALNGKRKKLNFDLPINLTCNSEAFKFRGVIKLSPIIIQGIAGVVVCISINLRA
jgi:hypothetical protein